MPPVFAAAAKQARRAVASLRVKWQEYEQYQILTKSYPPTWKGDLLLACRKCQKKLKGNAAIRLLAKLKKTVKRRNMLHPGAMLHVLEVPCLDLCPNVVVLSVFRQLARRCCRFSARKWNYNSGTAVAFFQSLGQNSATSINTPFAGSSAEP